MYFSIIMCYVKPPSATTLLMSVNMNESDTYKTDCKKIKPSDKKWHNNKYCEIRLSLFQICPAVVLEGRAIFFRWYRVNNKPLTTPGQPSIQFTTLSCIHARRGVLHFSMYWLTCIFIVTVLTVWTWHCYVLTPYSAYLYILRGRLCTFMDHESVYTLPMRVKMANVMCSCQIVRSECLHREACLKQPKIKA